MKKLSLGLAALLGAIGNVALAADLPVKAPPAAYVAASPWTGFYVGVEGGWAWAHAAQTNLISHVSDGFYDQSGGLLGGTVGYNWQVSNWILGLESDLAWAHITGAETICGPTHNQTCPTEIRAFGTARGRAGIAVWTNTMLYATGGLAYGDIHAFKENVVVTGGDTWRAGWTVGAGIETMFLPKWSVKLEYLYANFPGTATTYTIVNSNTPIAAVERDVQMIRGGVNWHF
jgi:outer membrane immunogenic protein